MTVLTECMQTMAVGTSREPTKFIIVSGCWTCSTSCKLPQRRQVGRYHTGSTCHIRGQSRRPLSRTAACLAACYSYGTPHKYVGTKAAVQVFFCFARHAVSVPNLNLGEVLQQSNKKIINADMATGPPNQHEHENGADAVSAWRHSCWPPCRKQNRGSGAAEAVAAGTKREQQGRTFVAR